MHLLFTGTTSLYGDLLAGCLSRPVASRRVRHVGAPADLGESNAGEAILIRKAAHGRRPDLRIQLLPSESGHSYPPQPNKVVQFEGPDVPLARRLALFFEETGGGRQ